MPKLIPTATGIIAVILYLASYQQKKRKNIIALNVTSRILFIIQYIMLGAFEGAVLDVSGAVTSVIAMKKDNEKVKKHIVPIMILVDLLIIGAGLSVYKNILSLFPIIAVLLQTGAFWFEDEKKIRIVSLVSCPFWFLYNFPSGAYGSCVGDILSAVSIIIAMIRYRDKNNEKTPQ